jgi:hypothetical protein
VHRSLRSGGLLLDVHPQPKPSPIEVQAGSSTIDLGQLEYGADFVGNMSTAEEVLASLVRGGAFTSEREEEFLLRHHFDSLADWQDYMEKEAEYYLQPDATMIEAIGRGMATAGAEIVLKEWVRASRLRRLG